MKPRLPRTRRAHRSGTASVELTVLLVCITIMGLASWSWFGPIIHRIIYGDD